MQVITIIIYTTIFDYTFIIKNLIYCNNLLNYKNFTDYINLIIRKVAIKAIISFIIKKFAIYINIAEKVVI